MGLLDALTSGSQVGYGGLLDMLMYNSPLLKQQEVPQGPQYDPMGTPFASAPQSAESPFGPLPQMNQPAPYRPPSVFNNGAAPVAGFAPASAAPALPPAQTVVPPAEPPSDPARTMNVGGYQMPQFGSAQDYTPKSATDISAQSRGAPQQPQQLPPALAGQPGGFGGAMQGFAANAHNGPLGMLMGGIGGAMGMEGPEKQNLRAQYQSLVPMLGPQKAMLAVMNPEAGKILLAQALEKQQPTFGVIGEGDGGGKAYGFIDPTKKAVTPYTPPSASEDKGVMGPDGKMIPYPEGVDKKTFRNEISKINADSAGGKKTEVQAKAEKFGNKMELAEKNISSLQGEGTSLVGHIASGVPLGNYVQTKEYQKYAQAKNNFITALLRDESGAAIGTQEFVRYDKELFPQPGDGPDVIAQKAEARRVATDAMKKSAGPGYKSPTSAAPAGLPSGWSVQVR